ncbi:MAG: IS66 family insertion sequence element accessory protein TnpB [Longimicrobiales bacterium]
MLSFAGDVKVFLAPGATDMRKSFDTLACVVQETIRSDPLSGHVFGFCNRTRDRMKVLYWDRTGYCLISKRLERGRFAWPKADETASAIEMTGEALAQLLGGIERARAERGHWYAWSPRPDRTEALQHAEESELAVHA